MSIKAKILFDVKTDIDDETKDKINDQVKRINEMADDISEKLSEWPDCTVDEAQGAFLMALMHSLTVQDKPGDAAIKTIVSLLMFSIHELGEEDIFEKIEVLYEIIQMASMPGEDEVMH